MFSGMVAHRAHVENGRIVVDEPTDLPEGTLLEVGSLQVVEDSDDLNEADRAELHEALDEALASVEAGKSIDGNEVLRRLMKRP